MGHIAQTKLQSKVEVARILFEELILFSEIVRLLTKIVRLLSEIVRLLAERAGLLSQVV